MAQFRIISSTATDDDTTLEFQGTERGLERAVKWLWRNRRAAGVVSITGVDADDSEICEISE